MQDEEILNQIKSRPRIGLARQLARKLLKEAKIKGAPISMQKIGEYMEQKYNLQLQGLKNFFSDKVSGLTVIIDETPTIGFNKDQSWYRRRFTIAHEIGHFMLNTAHYKQSGDSGDMQTIDTANPIEKEANAFAAELLMPLQQFKKDYRGSLRTLEGLSAKYQVSQHAAALQLSNSGALAKV